MTIKKIPPEGIVGDAFKSHLLTMQAIKNRHIDIEAIKKKWQKRSKPIESNAVTATAQQIEINKRQQEIGEQRIITEFLSDLQGEK